MSVHECRKSDKSNAPHGRFLPRIFPSRSGDIASINATRQRPPISHCWRNTAEIRLMRTPDRPVPLTSLYGLFFVVGLCSFGGGVTAWFHREVVLARKWMSDDEFFSGYSLAQVLPGVNSTN